MRGVCSRSESAAIAAHVVACASCAAEASLEAALTHAAGIGAGAFATPTARREAIWRRIEPALSMGALPPAARKVPFPRPRWRLGWVAVLLVLGPWLGTHWSSAPAGKRLDFTPHAHRALWEPEALTDDDPMGATTDALLALLEARH
jgi:hypothetical protein